MANNAGRTLRVAVEGCGHGTLNAIYAAVGEACQARNWPAVDLVIIGGDFQAVRNAADLAVLSAPAKFREIGDFHEYYSGIRQAPYLTIFVGGNHEASSYLWELYHGGWVAPNIYYMGAANVLKLGPVRIAGMSGIWKGYNFNKSHHERLPYNQDDIKSIYHVRELDVRKLLQIRTQVDIGISHDWPRAIEKHGDERSLFRMKPDFEQESRDGTLGNQAATYVMDRLRPPYWFAAHMHCKFAAIKSYDGVADTPSELQSAMNGEAPTSAIETSKEAPHHNADEIDLDMDDEDTVVVAGNGTNEPSKTTSVSEDLRAQLPAAFSRPSARRLQPGQPTPATITNKSVRFLALDKCLPGRKFLQLLDIIPIAETTDPHQSSPPWHLEYDAEWLAITRAFAPSLTLGDRNSKPPPDLGEDKYRTLIAVEEAWVHENIVEAGKLKVPENFSLTAPVHDKSMPENSLEQPREYNNPQTIAFCELLGIENKFYSTEEERLARVAAGPPPAEPRRDGGFGGGKGRGRDGGRGFGSGRGRGGGRDGGRGGRFGGKGRARGY